MSTHIVCLGNELVGDDGIGIRIGRVLSELKLSHDVTVELRYNLGFDLLDLLEASAEEVDLVAPSAAGPQVNALTTPRQLVIVDAMSSGCAPGTCTVWTGTELLSCALAHPGRTCCHVIGIGGVLDIARKEWPGVVERCLTVVGVEGQDFTEYTTSLSHAVRAALPSAVEQVLTIAGAAPEVRSRARALCSAWMKRDPTVREICLPAHCRSA